MCGSWWIAWIMFFGKFNHKQEIWDMPAFWGCTRFGICGLLPELWDSIAISCAPSVSHSHVCLPPSVDISSCQYVCPFRIELFVMVFMCAVSKMKVLLLHGVSNFSDFMNFASFQSFTVLKAHLVPVAFVSNVSRFSGRQLSSLNFPVTSS